MKQRILKILPAFSLLFWKNTRFVVTCKQLAACFYTAFTAVSDRSYRLKGTLRYEFKLTEDILSLLKSKLSKQKKKPDVVLYRLIFCPIAAKMILT